MLQKELPEQAHINLDIEIFPDTGSLPDTSVRPQPPIGFALCALGFVLGILLTVTPLTRMPDRVLSLHSSLGSLLVRFGSWLPPDFGLARDSVNNLGSTACIEFFLVLALVVLCYGLGARLVQRQAEASNQRLTRRLIWLGTLLAGGIYVLTPAMLSHDILVYASYGRVLATYHANPYFVPIIKFPHDPFTAINYWSRTVSVYGPIWIFLCGFFARFLAPTPETVVRAFRLFALAIHLINIWLVGRTLQQMGRAPRTVTLGMLLYAWNPLVLLESGLGGHNDILMLMFSLLGVLLAVHAERRGQLLRPRGYLPPVALFTLAVLVKITALPMLLLYPLFLVCKTLRPTTAEAFREALRNWQAVLRLLAWSTLTALLFVLALYGPFWFWHSLTEITASFKHAPSSIRSDNSLMRSVVLWLHEKPATTFPFTLLTSRSFWDKITSIVLALCLLLGAYKLWVRPTIKQMVLATLGTMGAVLLVTPWFFSWYTIWLIGLAAISLPVRQGRLQAALLAFTLTFSVSALLTYLFTNGYHPLASWAYLVSALTIMPPTCTFFLVLVLWRPAHYHTIGDREQC